jgi:serine protease inhibitor
MNDDRRDGEQFAEQARSTLRVLDRRTPVPIGWRPPDTVRRTAVVRRRRRWAIGVGIVLVAAVASALTLTSGSGGGTPQARLHGSVHTGARLDGAVQLVAKTAPATAADHASIDAVVAAEQRLSLAFLQKAADGSNIAVSPASLYLALGMLQNGARGDTAAQISAALQAGGISTAEQNAGLAGLMADLDAAAAKAGITLDSANSLWQQKGFAVRPTFLRALATYYRSGVWQVDYRHDMSGAMKAINDWTSQQTHGKITKLFDQLDPSTVLVLANAIYFHAAWATPFDAGLTTDGTFTTAEGRAVPAKFMSGGTGLQAVATGDYQAVQLPYRGSRFAALAIMPMHGSLTDLVRELTPDRIAAIAASTSAGWAVDLPRFTTTSEVDLKPVLSALGMSGAFTDSADLSGLSPVPTKVDQIIQRVYLGVGEKGTTAAAATGISIVPTSGTAQSVRFDHPFLFLVRDTRTGAILFASEVQDPSS